MPLKKNRDDCFAYGRKCPFYGECQGKGAKMEGNMTFQEIRERVKKRAKSSAKTERAIPTQKPPSLPRVAAEPRDEAKIAELSAKIAAATGAPLRSQPPGGISKAGRQTAAIGTLYIDCMPLQGDRPTEFASVVLEFQDMIYEHKVEQFAKLDTYEIALRDHLEKHEYEAVCVSSRDQFGRDAIPVLMSLASAVVRGL